MPWHSTVPSPFLLQMFNNPSLCMDDGGGLTAGSSRAYLGSCNPNNNNQKFTIFTNGGRETLPLAL